MGLGLIENRINDNYISKFDLSLYYLKRGQFLVDIIKLFFIENSYEFINNQIKVGDYLKVLTDCSDGIKFININNFKFIKEKRKLSSLDMRLIVSDITRKATEDQMMHIISIGLMMLTRQISEPEGYAYISNFVSKFGTLILDYCINGYLHIIIVEKDNVLSYRITGLNPETGKYLK